MNRRPRHHWSHNGISARSHADNATSASIWTLCSSFVGSTLNCSGQISEGGKGLTMIHHNEPWLTMMKQWSTRLLNMTKHDYDQPMISSLASTPADQRRFNGAPSWSGPSSCPGVRALPSTVNASKPGTDGCVLRGAEEWCVAGLLRMIDES